MAKNSETITVPFDLMKDEVVISVLEQSSSFSTCTYGTYPSLPCSIYLTNNRVVIKVLPFWGTVINKIIDFDIPFSVTKAIIPLSSIEKIKIKKMSWSIYDGVKTHIIQKSIKMIAGKDENVIVNRIAQTIHEQYGRDVLAHD